jgi:hypothetical protein
MYIEGITTKCDLSASDHTPLAIIYLLGTFIADLLKSRRRFENLFLRHQLTLLDSRYNER